MQQILYRSTNNVVGNQNTVTFTMQTTTLFKDFDKAVVKGATMQVYSLKSQISNNKLYLTRDGDKRFEVKIGSISTGDPGASKSANPLVISNTDLAAFFSGVLSHGNMFVMTMYIPRAQGTNTSFTIRDGAHIDLILDVETQYTPTSFQFTSDSVQFGQQLDINCLNEDLDSLSHQLYVNLFDDPTKNLTLVFTKGQITQQSPRFDITIPFDWMSAISNSDHGSMTVQLKTFKHVTSDVDPDVDEVTQLGSSVRSINVYIPDQQDYYPKIKGVDIAKINLNDAIDDSDPNWHFFLQQMTGAIFTIHAEQLPELTYSYSISCRGGVVYSVDDAQPNQLKINKFTGSGTISYVATVTDSRGRSSQFVGDIEVVPYSMPTIDDTLCYRVNEDKIADEHGSYGLIRMDGDVAACNGMNRKTLSIGYSLRDDVTNPNTLSTLNYLRDDGSVAPAVDLTGKAEYLVGEFGVEESYYIYFVNTDIFGNYTMTRRTLQTQMFAIHVKNGGNGVAFGKISQMNGAVQLNEEWSLWLGKTELKPPFSIRAGGTGGTNKQTANANINYAGQHPISKTADDDVRKWMDVGADTISYYSGRDMLQYQPSYHGILETMSNGVDQVNQLWFAQPTTPEDRAIYARTGVIDDNGQQQWIGQKDSMWSQVFTDTSVVPIKNGGTGARTVEQARNNLGITAGELMILSDVRYSGERLASEFPVGISAVPVFSRGVRYPTLKSTVLNFNVDNVGRNVQLSLDGQGVAAYRGQKNNTMDQWQHLLTSTQAARIEIGKAQISRESDTVITFEKAFSARPYVFASYSHQFALDSGSTNISAVRIYEVTNVGFKAKIGGTNGGHMFITWIAFGA